MRTSAITTTTLRRALTATLLVVPVAPVAPVVPIAPVIHAQLPDPHTIPRGALRVAFDPSWLSYAELYDPAGTRLPLGTYYSADTLGSGFFPTLTDAEAAVRALTGDAAFRFNAGRFRARFDADVRRFPFSFSVGLSSRLTLTATVPLVTTRVKAAPSLDSTGSEAGWNPISGQGSAGALDSLTTLLTELDAAAAQLEADIAAGGFDCPNGPTCDEARALVTRIRGLSADLGALTGYGAAVGGGGPIPPLAPLAGSAAGQAIRAAIADVHAALVALGQLGLTTTVPLPAVPIDSNAVDLILTGAEFGYGALPFDRGETIKLSGLGDVELGLRYGLLTGPTFRAVLDGRVRLPTGKKQDDPNDFLDIAPADGQLDVAVRLDGAFEPGSRLGVWFSGGYTRQFSDNLTRRVARLDAPIVPAAAVTEVRRQLADEVRVSLHPALRLTPSFRAFVSASYYHKGPDTYEVNGAPVPELEALTARTLWTIGGGLSYRMESNRRRASLPVEAGFHYAVAVYGSQGLVPKSGRMSLSLRFFYNLWGRAPEPEPEPQPAPEPEPPPPTPPGYDRLPAAGFRRP
jgi:hypothetical protein